MQCNINLSDNLLGYSVEWTGFRTETLPNGEFIQGKKLWDWMELLIIPLVLAIGAFFLNHSERSVEHQIANERIELEREIAKDRQQEVAFQTYIDRMSELLLKEKLRTTEKPEVRDVARTRTVSIMRVLDTKRSNLVIQFLREAQIITDENSIFVRADMREMDLQNLDFTGAFLKNALLTKANLTEASLVVANLEGSSLEEANLERTMLAIAILKKANLTKANLERAFLVNADLTEANLTEANLTEANLKGAQVTNEQLY
jgi:uncharacterized protein YjbI with pentapeptide repeats